MGKEQCAREERMNGVEVICNGDGVEVMVQW